MRVRERYFDKVVITAFLVVACSAASAQQSQPPAPPAAPVQQAAPSPAAGKADPGNEVKSEHKKAKAKAKKKTKPATVRPAAQN